MPPMPRTTLEIKTTYLYVCLFCVILGISEACHGTIFFSILKDARSVSFYPDNRSQILQYVEYTK